MFKYDYYLKVTIGCSKNMTTNICEKECSPKREEDEDIPIDNYLALEIFEQAHFLYGTQSVEETVNVLMALGLEVVIEKALDRHCVRNLNFSIINTPTKYLESARAG